MKGIRNDYFNYQKHNLPFILHKNVSSATSSFYTNWHTEPEFILTTGGSETIYVDNDVFATKPGDIIAIGSGRVHTGPGTNWAHHCLIPSVEFLETLEIIPTVFSFPSPLIRDKKMTKLFLKMVETYDDNGPFRRPKAIVAVEDFLLSIYEQYAQRSDQTAPHAKGDSHFAITAKVINYLRSNFATDFSIDTIAEEIGITTSYMCRCVKMITGKTIVEHLNEIRCRAAYHYLTHSDKNIYEIATLCGFNNSSYFAKIYQQIMGTSPSEARNSH